MSRYPFAQRSPAARRQAAIRRHLPTIGLESEGLPMWTKLFNRPADVALSLGTNCEMAFNLNAFYGPRKAGLLDWMITPLSALPGLITSGFRLVGPGFAEALERVELGGGSDSVMHVPSGILLHHAFPRDAERVNPAWQDGISEVAKKYTYLGTRMEHTLRKARKPVLFLNRAGLHEGMTREMHEASLEPGIYQEILQAVRAINPRGHLVILNGNPAGLERVRRKRGVHIAEVRNFGVWHEGIRNHFGGCREGWYAALDGLGIAVRRSEAAPVFAEKAAGVTESGTRRSLAPHP